MSDVRVLPVEDGADFRRFITFPWEIYRRREHLPNWVPPLIASEKALFDRRRCPYFEHGDARFFLARRNGRPVGRIAAITNDAHVDYHGEKTGFFGFFESIRDQEVTNALVAAAADWVRERGLELMRGPMNYSTNETCGLLVDGFDEPPTVMMTYNPPWYSELLEGAGMKPAKELLSYLVRNDQLPDRILHIAEKTKHKASIEFRRLNMKRFEEEVALIKEIYNDAWERNWGFVPMTEAEIDHMAAELKPVVDPDLVLLAFIGGQMAGFSLALPDVNQILLGMNGRLFPFGIFKLLAGRKHINHARVIALGVRKIYQGLGLGSLFYAETFKTAVEKGYLSGEASWILEDNEEMRRPMELMGAVINKRYMVYELPLEG